MATNMDQKFPTIKFISDFTDEQVTATVRALGWTELRTLGNRVKLRTADGNRQMLRAYAAHTHVQDAVRKTRELSGDE